MQAAEVERGVSYGQKLETRVRNVYAATSSASAYCNLACRTNTQQHAAALLAAPPQPNRARRTCHDDCLLAAV